MKHTFLNENHMHMCTMTSSVSCLVPHAKDTRTERATFDLCGLCVQFVSDFENENARNLGTLSADINDEAVIDKLP